MNGVKLNARNDEIIELFLAVAAGQMSREAVEEKFAGWLAQTEK